MAHQDQITMPAKYSHEKTEAGDYQILRNDVVVATYDAIEDDVTYTEDNDRYAGPIGREVAKIKRGEDTLKDIPDSPEAFPDPEPKPDKQPAPEAPVTAEVIRLRAQVASLEQELADMRNPGTRPSSPPARYEGIEYQPEGSPEMGPHGDLDEEFVKWCRNGGVSKEHFIQRYRGRLKDLTYNG